MSIFNKYYDISQIENILGGENTLVIENPCEPFALFNRINPEQLVDFFQSENITNIVIALSVMETESAAIILSGLSDDLKFTVSTTISTKFKELTPGIIEECSIELSDKLILGNRKTPDGVSRIAKIFNKMGINAQTTLELIDSSDKQLALEIKEKMTIS